MEELGTLVERARAGDLEAYGRVVRRFQDMAYGYAYSLVGDYHLAEDAAQEAFLQAYRDLGALRDPKAFPGWLRRIMHKCCDRLTRRRRVGTVPLDAAMEAASRAPGPGDVAQRREMAEAVTAAIRSLPETQRTTVTLFYIDGYSQADVAEFLDVPLGTVKRRLHTSRERLKERMLEMVADELKGNALPDDFAQATVERLMTQACELNERGEAREAETVLRDVLRRAPGHPDALEELNRALLHGRIWRDQLYDLLPELVTGGLALLKSGPGDDTVHRRVADTLLYMPAMPKAIEFIESWIDEVGEGLVPLGRLAYAHGCVAGYDAAEATWARFLACAKRSVDEDTATSVATASDALVECLAAAGQTERAARVARSACDLACSQGMTHVVTRWLGWKTRFDGDPELRTQCVALAQKHIEHLERGDDPDPDTRLSWFVTRLWLEDVETVAADWLAWIDELAASTEGHGRLMQTAAGRMLAALAVLGQLDERRQLGLATAERVERARSEDERRFARWIVGTALAPELYINAGDLDTAEDLARQAMEAYHEGEAEWLYEIAVIRGQPSPPDLMRRIADEGIDANRPCYGAWYHVAREAAAAGDETEAFNALRRAFEHWWYLKPLVQLERWESDARWGALRQHAEFRRIFDEQRQRIGPIHGELKYSPGW